MQKTSRSAAYELAQALAVVGGCLVVHVDRGAEFSRKFVNYLREFLGSTFIVVRGAPRHPQSQGFIERLNQEIKRRLRAIACEWAKSNTGKQPPWMDWLPRVLLALNVVPLRSRGRHNAIYASIGHRPIASMWSEIVGSGDAPTTEAQLMQALRRNGGFDDMVASLSKSASQMYASPGDESLPNPVEVDGLGAWDSGSDVDEEMEGPFLPDAQAASAPDAQVHDPPEPGRLYHCYHLLIKFSQTPNLIMGKMYQ